MSIHIYVRVKLFWLIHQSNTQVKGMSYAQNSPYNVIKICLRGDKKGVHKSNDSISETNARHTVKQA